MENQKQKNSTKKSKTGQILKGIGLVTLGVVLGCAYSNRKDLAKAWSNKKNSGKYLRTYPKNFNNNSK